MDGETTYSLEVHRVEARSMKGGPGGMYRSVVLLTAFSALVFLSFETAYFVVRYLLVPELFFTQSTIYNLE